MQHTKGSDIFVRWKSIPKLPVPYQDMYLLSVFAFICQSQRNALGVGKSRFAAVIQINDT